MPTSLLSNMNKNYDFTVKLKANDTGSAVLIKHNDHYSVLHILLSSYPFSLSSEKMVHYRLPQGYHLIL